MKPIWTYERNERDVRRGARLLQRDWQPSRICLFIEDHIDEWDTNIELSISEAEALAHALLEWTASKRPKHMTLKDALRLDGMTITVTERPGNKYEALATCDTCNAGGASAKFRVKDLAEFEATLHCAWRCGCDRVTLKTPTQSEKAATYTPTGPCHYIPPSVSVSPLPKASYNVPNPLADMRAQATVDAWLNDEEGEWGADREDDYPERTRCASCHGSGEFKLFTSTEACSDCHGTGWS